ncbi:unnamed protein product [Dovyalis caffra]|uniref:Glycine-rich protein n=1 Tax=Dovyalis caffra TaxID=77055 RepID=A0AAV1RPW9_9ROSI|nr:unnamed protein product [Dovyalis caffra]
MRLKIKQHVFKGPLVLSILYYILESFLGNRGVASTHDGYGPPEMELGNEAGGRRKGRVDLWVVSGGYGGGDDGFCCIAGRWRERGFGKRDSLISESIFGGGFGGG